MRRKISQISSLLSKKDEKHAPPLSKGRDLKEGKGFEKLLMIRSDETARLWQGGGEGVKGGLQNSVERK